MDPERELIPFRLARIAGLPADITSRLPPIRQVHSHRDRQRRAETAHAANRATRGAGARQSQMYGRRSRRQTRLRCHIRARPRGRPVAASGIGSHANAVGGKCLRQPEGRLAPRGP
jgi:hypothetical protein